MKSNEQVIQELTTENEGLGKKLKKITVALYGDNGLNLRLQQVQYLMLQQKIISAYMDVLSMRIADLKQAIKEDHDD